MVLDVVLSDGDIMPPYFFPEGLKVTANDYIKVLETVVKPWMVGVAGNRPYVFQQDCASAYGPYDPGLVVPATTLPLVTGPLATLQP